MNEEPKVSIIITTYNRADKVCDTIDSVLNQEYSNFEIIVVEDCSPDNTQEIVKNKYSNTIKYIRHEQNQGVAIASNTGFKYASGKYLAFIGDDDIWIDQQKLKKQVEVFENDKANKYGITTCSVILENESGKKELLIKNPKNLLKHLLGKNGIIYGSAALLRREAFINAGKFSLDTPKGTDSDVYRRIVLMGYDCYFIKKPMLLYDNFSSDRMTTLNEKGINKNIMNQMYKLQRYGDYYSRYRSAKSVVYYELANMYREQYRRKEVHYLKDVAKKFYLFSYFNNPINYKSLAKYLILSFKDH